MAAKVKQHRLSCSRAVMRMLMMRKEWVSVPKPTPSSTEWMPNARQSTNKEMKLCDEEAAVGSADDDDEEFWRRRVRMRFSSKL